MADERTSKNIDIVTAVQELNEMSSRELSKSLKESENFTVQYTTRDGFVKQIDMEKLASSLPLHLMAVILSPDRDTKMAYLLRGIRLLHTLSELATRHARLEQVLLDDVKLSEQVLDLVFFILIVLAHQKQDNHLGASPFLHSALVACSLHLLTSYLSSQWPDLVHALLAHPKVNSSFDRNFFTVSQTTEVIVYGENDFPPLHFHPTSTQTNMPILGRVDVAQVHYDLGRQVDIFMDVTFNSLHEDIRILRTKLSTLTDEVLLDKSSLPAALRTAHYICQQCEASLQFLLSLCQQKSFRDRVLRNKELSKNGGILSLARTVLRLSVPECLKESSDVVSAVSRLKAKVLSILLQLCEAENISYLDEVAGSSKSKQLGQSVALEFLDLLKTQFRREGKQPATSHERSNPRGFLLINALRLVDIFSDDSNFRCPIMTTTVPFLTEILAVPNEEFVGSWCSENLRTIEEDANLEYDPLTAAGIALVSLGESTSFLLTETNYVCPFIINSMPSVTYAQQRTSCLVKIIANLHVFVPNICKEQERDLFLREFHNYLLQEKPESSTYVPNSYLPRATSVYKNLCSLLLYAKSLIPNLLIEDDVQLLRIFTDTLQNLTHLQVGENLAAKDEGNPDDGVETIKQSLPKLSNSPDSNFNKIHKDIQDGSGKQETLNLGIDVARDPAKDLPNDFEVNQATNRNKYGSFRSIEKEICNVETNSVELNGGKMDLDVIPHGGECAKSGEYMKEIGLQEDEKAEATQGEEKQPRKRKRNIMNDKQISAIEEALLEEPEMQRNAALLQSWADKLSSQGSEITASQLKNWK
ncbi:nodulin homeobox isoform X6 [Ananas comosus]|uniref:Nodulin homeobox isoform X6 n=1 Tax=Ananas comosus TaxID=4615 RepID=A0A6P5G2F7_ANACO|nr:nodulin homeobox isoform X6 [Ananas comosus]